MVEFLVIGGGLELGLPCLDTLLEPAEQFLSIRLLYPLHVLLVVKDGIVEYLLDLLVRDGRDFLVLRFAHRSAVIS